MIFLPVIAGLAAGDAIGLARGPAPDDGDNVVHGQVSGVESTFAVMAEPFSLLVLPPLGLAQIASLVPFTADVLFICGFREETKLQFVIHPADACPCFDFRVTCGGASDVSRVSPYAFRFPEMPSPAEDAAVSASRGAAGPKPVAHQ